uniref:Uncharacterized protein n=1 Tax=Strigamia maritima TaxID=126957 RepID=T1J3N5_STRMM
MAPHTFTNETHVEFLLLYFRNGENQSKASQLSAELHPDQPAPSHKVVGRILKTNKTHPCKTRFVQELLIEILI